MFDSIEPILVVVVAAVFVIAAVLWARRRHSGGIGDVDDAEAANGEQHPHLWGYSDTQFEFDGPRAVRVTGNRYPISGFRMPHFVGFIEEVLGVTIEPGSLNKPIAHPELPASLFGDDLVQAFSKTVPAEQISRDDASRLLHSHGQLSVDEIYRLLYQSPPEKVVDAVICPANEEEVVALVTAAEEHDVCLVPYGGGTNVTGALLCNDDGVRPLVSLDMRRMARILWLDEVNHTACVEAGVTGKALEAELASRGYTCGHEPDSVEFSTLGGWISTNASGMKRNRYGNIEDIVLDVSMVTPTGQLGGESQLPRVSTGPQAHSLIFGSEGNFGVITKAVMKIFPLPTERVYASLIFPAFSDGTRFIKALCTEGLLPASIRLVNNNEFRFGQALKPEASFFSRILSRFQHFILIRLKRLDPNSLVACTVLIEGARADARAQRKKILRRARAFGGISGGARNGKRGYTLTFGIAYIRDFLSQLNILGETFETSVGWDRVEQVLSEVSQTLATECHRYKVFGKPYLGYRLTQAYGPGVCLYFTMGFSGKGLESPDEVFHDIEHALRRTILANGGSLSHHHGVGKIRSGFLPEVHSRNHIRMLHDLKHSLDPNNVFGISNGVFALDEARVREPGNTSQDLDERDSRASKGAQ